MPRSTWERRRCPAARTPLDSRQTVRPGRRGGQREERGGRQLPGVDAVIAGDGDDPDLGSFVQAALAVADVGPTRGDDDARIDDEGLRTGDAGEPCVDAEEDRVGDLVGLVGPFPATRALPGCGRLDRMAPTAQT